MMDIETDHEYLADALETLEAYQHRAQPRLSDENAEDE